MRIKNILLCIVLSIIFCFVGCGTEAELSDNDLIKINSDGTISVVIYDTFDKDYYSEDELVSMATDEANKFNSVNGENKIRVGNHSLQNGIISLELIFADVNTFNQYMPNKLFSGTIEGAQLSGYDLNRSLNIVGRKGATIGKNDLSKMDNSNVVIINGAYGIETPGKITYYSQGMDYINNNTVSASLNGIYYVMYK